MQLLRTLIVITLLTLVGGLFAQTPEYILIDSSTGQPTDWATVAQNLSLTDVVFFGELHDDVLMHRLEAEFLTACGEKYNGQPTRVQKIPSAALERNTSLAVSFEMFERDTQPVLDDYLAGKITENDFLGRSRPWPNYSTDYRPLLEYAKAHHLPVIAANVPRDLAARIHKEGIGAFDQFTPQEHTYAARQLTTPDDDYKTHFTQIMVDNMGMNGAVPDAMKGMVGNLYAAQCLKDDTMGESLANFLNGHPHTLVVHFNGDFHSTAGLGTPKRLQTQRPGTKVRIISPVVLPDDQPLTYNPDMKGLGNYLILMHSPAEDSTAAVTPPAKTGNGLRHLDIKLSLDPKNHRLRGSDSLWVWQPLSVSDTLVMLASLKITAVHGPNGVVPFICTPINDTYQGIQVMSHAPMRHLSVDFEGPVYNPLKGRAMNQTHDDTAGIISTADGEGIYLSYAGLYPVLGDSLFTFRTEVTCPDSVKLVSSGRLTQAVMPGDSMRYVWEGELPAAQLTLVGNRFMEFTRAVDNVTLRVMLLPSEKDLGQTYLNGLEQVYRRYTTLLGDYPFSSFTLVENFFASGFGMPGYTVLAPELVKMPNITLNPGALPHEFVHGWWGNGVEIDPKDGNWCESLTTFCANYWWNLLENDPDAAQAWRVNALQEISLLPVDRRFPLRQFKTQTNDDDAVIGYRWGGMFFVQLQHQMGDRFFADLRAFAKQYRGQRVGWNQLLAALAPLPDSSIVNLLESTELPRLSITENTVADRQAKGKTALLLHATPARGTLWVEMGYTPAPKVPVMCQVVNGLCAFYPDSKVKSVDIDPNAYLLREIPPANMPCNLQRTLLNGPLAVLPDNDPLSVKLMMTISLLNQSGYSVAAVPASQLGVRWKDNSLIVFGSWDSNGYLKNLQLPQGFAIDSTKIVTPQGKFTSPQASLILSYEHPTAPGKFISVYAWRTPAAVTSFRRMMHYLSDSWQIFDPNQKKDGPVGSGMLYPAGKKAHDWEKTK